MRFNIGRRVHHVGKINPRSENHGAEKIPATDIPLTCEGTKRDLDMLVRCVLPKGEAQKFSDLIYSNGILAFPDLTPLPINRTPDELDVEIWDQQTKRGASLKFTKAKIKSIYVELGPRHKLSISYTLQLNHIDPDRDAARLYRLMDNDADIEIKATQDDLFDEGDEDDDDQKKDAQGNLIDSPEDEEND